MEREEIGRFSATTFNGNVIEFIVFNNYTMSCPTLGINSFNRIILKPRFVLVGKDLYYTYGDDNKEEKDPNVLISNYDINEQLFDHLKSLGMIKYSTDMAYLYGFSDKSGYDNGRYGVGSPYKWAKKKGPILSKQRSGKFN